MQDAGHWRRFNPARRRIRLLPGPGLHAESAVDFSVECRQAGVRGPHPHERLANGADHVLNMLSCDGPVTGGNSAVSALLRECLEEGDRIFNIGQEGVELVLGAELQPNDPVAFLFGCGFWFHTLEDGFLCKAEISEECVGVDS